MLRFIAVKNHTISAVLGNSSSPSGNLNFCRNLVDMEIENFERLMSSLTLMHLSPFAVDQELGLYPL